MKPIEITKNNYKSEIELCKTPILMVFTSTKCPTCRLFAPVMNQLATTISHVKIAAVNFEKEYELVSRYNITVIPTVVYIKNGEVKTLKPGYKRKEELLELIGK